MQLIDKTIIITGASSGIGAAAARLFSADGANVVMGARRQENLDELLVQTQHNGGNSVVHAGDACDESFARALVGIAISEFGGLDGAFNNVGITGTTSNIPDMSNENWHQVIATNLTSAFYAAKYQIPVLKNQGGGAILYTSSFVGHTSAGMSGMGAYAASKAGLNGLVQSLAAEHGADGIRVNALLPGGTKTAMAGSDPDVHDHIASLHPLQRMAEPEEIAEVAMFLLSGSSSFVTGTAMLADGGVSVKLG